MTTLFELYQILTERFSESDLRTLCFSLGIDYDSLPGEGKANKARELIAYLERRHDLSRLARMGKRQRPDIPWGEVPQTAVFDSIRKLVMGRKLVIGAIITGSVLALIVVLRPILVPGVSATPTPVSYPTIIMPSSTGGPVPVAKSSSLVTPSILPTETPYPTLKTPTFVATVTQSMFPTMGPTLRQPTPVSVIYTVTTRTGVEVQLAYIRLGVQVQEPHSPSSQFYGYAGIPLKNGEIIAFDYISRVEFDDNTGDSGPVTITLVDGTKRRDHLGLDIFPGLTLYSTTTVGTFSKSLKDIKTIVVERASSSRTLPQTVSSGAIATIVLTNSERLRVSNMGLNFISPPNTYVEGRLNPWCVVSYESDLPTVEGFQISLYMIKEIEFLYEKSQDNLLPVNIVTSDGQILAYKAIVPEERCMGGWRLTGLITLGYFEIPLGSVRKIAYEKTEN